MRIIGEIYCKIILLCILFSLITSEVVKSQSVFKVRKLTQPLIINANWDKQQWKKVDAIELNNYMGDKPTFSPFVQAKMMYDDLNIYVIFHVQDKFVRCITKTINGRVWEDSAVEFFFAPDTSLPLRYFNLEINCGGTPLMHYNVVPRKEINKLDIEEIKKIKIAHSLPQIVDPEIKEAITWTIEYRIPIDMLRKYSKVTQPKPGSFWRCNFYKIGDKTSNPHYLTWSFIDKNEPDFHLPQSFGIIKFE